MDIVYVVDQPGADEARWLASVIEEHQPAFVLIDTIGRFSKIENVNDYSQVTRATQPMLDLRSRLGTTFAFLHHNNHADKTLGSTQWEAAVDTIMTLSRGLDGTRFVMTKQRSGVDMERTVLCMDQATGSITCDVPAFIADKRVAEQRILEHLRATSRVTREDLAKVGGRKVGPGRAAVDALVAAGLIRFEGSGLKGDPRVYSAIERQGLLEKNTDLYIVEDSEESRGIDPRQPRCAPHEPEDSEESEESRDIPDDSGDGWDDFPPVPFPHRPSLKSGAPPIEVTL